MNAKALREENEEKGCLFGAHDSPRASLPTRQQFERHSRSHASRVVHVRDNEFILERIVINHLGMLRRLHPGMPRRLHPGMPHRLHPGMPRYLHHGMPRRSRVQIIRRCGVVILSKLRRRHFGLLHDAVGDTICNVVWNIICNVVWNIICNVVWNII